MGWYVRKSVKIGPFRLNASKSGLGISAGVKGFRVGTGPRGAYVHAGAKGIYYRKSLGSGSRPSYGEETPDYASLIAPANRPVAAIEPPRIYAGDVKRMSSAQSRELLRDLGALRTRKPQWRFYGAACFSAAAVIAYLLGSFWVFLALCVPAAFVTLKVLNKDVEKKVLTYDRKISIQQASAFSDLEACLAAMKTSSRIWYKSDGRSFGANEMGYDAYNGCTRDIVAFGQSLPEGLNCPVVPFSVTLRTKRLYFFPWFLLLEEAGDYGAIDYGVISVSGRSVTFTEEGFVPPDSLVVSRKYRYTTKSGAPDLRYKDNTMLTSVIYEEVRLSTGSGLDVTLMFSKNGPFADRLAKAFVGMSQAVAANTTEATAEGAPVVP